MTTQKRTIWDELIEIGRDIADSLDKVMNPHRRDPEPVRVPAPVRNNYPPQQEEYE